MIDWHRWLGTQGEGRVTGRAITGACNLAFFWLALTGVYRLVAAQLALAGIEAEPAFQFPPPRQSARLELAQRHRFLVVRRAGRAHLTAAVMSYPWANDLLYTLTGSEPPPRAQVPGPVAQAQQRRGAAKRRARRKPHGKLSMACLARAERQAPGWVMMMMRLPPRGDGPVTVLIQEPTAPHMFARSQLTLHSLYRRSRQMGALRRRQSGTKAASLGARPSHRRSSRFYRPDCRRPGLARWLLFSLDRFRHGLAALPLPQTRC